MKPRSPLLAVVLTLSALLLAQKAPTRQSERQIDPEHSTLTIHVGKAGLFSALGHEHEITAPVFSGSVRGRQAVEFHADARQLKVADKDVTEKDRAKIEETMLGPEVLDANHFSEIRFRSTLIEPEKAKPAAANEWRVHGELTLHGQTRRVVLEVKQEGERYTGSSTFKQTDFGIKPVSAGGGSVKVKDEVTVTFDIALK